MKLESLPPYRSYSTLSTTRYLDTPYSSGLNPNLELCQRTRSLTVAAMANGGAKAPDGAAKGLDNLEALRRELRAIKYDGVLDEAGCAAHRNTTRSVPSADLRNTRVNVQDCQGTRGCFAATAQPRPLLLLAPPRAVSR